MKSIKYLLGIVLIFFVTVFMITCSTGTDEKDITANPACSNCPRGYYQSSAKGCYCDPIPSPLINDADTYWYMSGNGEWNRILIVLNSDGTGVIAGGHINSNTQEFVNVTGNQDITWEETNPTTIQFSDNNTGIYEFAQIDPEAGTVTNPTHFSANVVYSGGTLRYGGTLSTGTF